MSSRILKIIAIITMTIDHIGLYLMEYGTTYYYVFRAVGRIAYPLFAFFIAEGFFHSHNLKKYFLRLLAYALVVEIAIIVYSLITKDNQILIANVLWPLVMGLLCLILLSRKEWYLKIMVLPLLVLAEITQIPYGAYGIGTIIIFGIYRDFRLQALFIVIMSILFIDYPLLELIGAGSLAKYPWIQWFSVLALIPIYFYNGKLGRSSKWFFYIYYPVHLGLILAISLII